MPRIISLTGVSASGKDTILKRVLEANKNLTPIVSWTTRPMRKGELEGREYYFKTRDDFKKASEKNKFIEFRIYHTIEGTWLYGINKETIDVNSNIDYIVIVDSNGREELSDFCRDNNIELKSYYIDCKYNICLQRSLNRQPNATKEQSLEMCRRLIDDDKVVNTKYIRSMTTILTNNNLNDLERNVDIVSKAWKEVL